jgi:hypothetical protein
VSRDADLAERKARLVAQSDLQRMQALLAWHSVRRIVAPPEPAERSQVSRSIATTLLGLAIPLVGAGKLRRTLRTLSTVATVVRIFRAWRRR